MVDLGRASADRPTSTCDILHEIALGTASTTGEEFFRALVRHVAFSLGAEHSFVSELLPGSRRVRTLAIWSRDRFLPDVEYDVDDTPCEEVLRGEICYYPQSVHRLFPEDRFLVDVGAESYLAVPLQGPGNVVHGHLAVIHGRTLNLVAHDLSVFRIFGARAAAEVLRRRSDDALRAANEELRVTLAELERAETQLVHSERMASTVRLVAGITHELNTPAGVVASVADVNARCVTELEQLDIRELSRRSERVERTLGVLVRNSQVAGAAAARIAEIVDALGRFVRLDEPHLQLTQVNQVVEQAVAMLAGSLPRVRIDTDLGKIPKLKCYPSELGHMLLQLLWNGADAIDGEGTITVRTRPSSSGITIDIIDTGRGIPSELLDRLFEPGFTSRASGVGKGLGLPICDGIARKHGGEIRISSEVGMGTRVTVSLPLSVPSQDIESGSRRRPASVMAPGTIAASGAEGTWSESGI